MTKALISGAMTALRRGLTRSPAALLAIGLAAGLSAQQAQAWGTQYEHIGRSIGYEVGRSVGGDSVFSPKSRIAALIGESVGSSLAKPLDDMAAARQKEDEIAKRAREQAVRDAAYEGERRRLDPAYSPVTSYQAMANRSDEAALRYSSIESNLRSMNERNEALVQEFNRRNARQQGR